MRVRIFFSNTPLLNFLPQPHHKSSLVLWHCFSAIEHPSPPPSFVMALRRHRVRGLLAGLAFLLFFSTDIGFCSGGIVQKEETSFMRRENAAAGRRLLAGIGSSPPTCRWRCGSCLPCRPIHVAIQPGKTIPLEYYPEAWRCKCGNKLFMP